MFERLPRTATLIEVGPRDGFQLETTPIPTDFKARTIESLIAAGLREIQVTAFVHPARVPQMADAEALIGRLRTRPDVVFTALTLNQRGVERAAAAGLTAVEVSASASNTHSRNNTGMSHADAVAEGVRMIRLARRHGMAVRASVQCAFGCVSEGEVPAGRVLETARRFLTEGVARISLADTTGMGSPRSVADRVSALMAEAGDIPVGLHLHDTRGLGLANLLSGLLCGVTHFDTAFGGMGGCPFVPGAAGNIPTEDTVHLMDQLGVETGVSSDRVAARARRMADFLGKPLPGKVHRLAGTDAEPAIPPGR